MVVGGGRLQRQPGLQQGPHLMDGLAHTALQIRRRLSPPTQLSPTRRCGLPRLPTWDADNQKVLQAASCPLDGMPNQSGFLNGCVASHALGKDTFLP